MTPSRAVAQPVLQSSLGDQKNKLADAAKGKGPAGSKEKVYKKYVGIKEVRAGTNRKVTGEPKGWGGTEKGWARVSAWL